MPEIQPSNKLNEIQKDSPKYSSTLEMERKKFFTPVFGKYVPFEVFECVPDDGPVSFRNESEQRSLSLSSPLMNKISISKDWFDVPFEAILPFNWDKIYKNPKLGDDINASLANTVIPNFHYAISTQISSEFVAIRDLSSYDFDTVLRFLRWVLFSELFISDGCLLAHLGCHFSPLLIFTPVSGPSRTCYFDEVVDSILPNLIGDSNEAIRFSFSGKDIRVDSAEKLRECLDMLRSGDTPILSGTFDLDAFKDSVKSWLCSIDQHITNSSSSVLNYSRCCAYQIVCAHFFTNDDVDYVYSAELYREYVHSLFINLQSVTVENSRSFVYNGLTCRYDWLSGSYLEPILWSSAVFNKYYPIVNAIFGFNNSLRYSDYFVGAKTRPIAIGDTNVSINADNTVSVVNITKNIQAQRFLNAVNRLKSGVDDYIKGIFGVDKISRDWHNPGWLAHTSDDVFANEVENTGEAQLTQANSITSNLRGSGRYEFTYYCERPCIVIGIEYFDVRRAYYTTQDKHTMKVDRFDGFIPEMQFIGDQPINQQELISSYSIDPFGYTTRNMEYKQLYDECLGGFVRNLPGWLFKFFPIDPSSEAQAGNVPIVQKPSFIRSRSSELDRYFVSLTGFTLMSGYFHFIEKSTTYISARRPMVKSPSIL